MKLFYAPGSSSLLTHIVLLEAGLAFTAVPIDEHTKAIEGGGDYRTVNPLGYVPALVLDDGTLLTEGPRNRSIHRRSGALQATSATQRYDRADEAAGVAELLLERNAQGCLWTPLLQGHLGRVESGVSSPSYWHGLRHLDRHLADHEYLVGERFHDSRRPLFHGLKLGISG